MDVGRRDDLFFGLHPILGGKLNVGRRNKLFFFWTSEDEMIFFFGLHSILGGKLDVERRDDLFFLDVGRRNDLFWVFTRFWEENWTSREVISFFFGLHLIEQDWTFKDVMTFFFGLHLILGGKLDLTLSVSRDRLRQPQSC